MANDLLNNMDTKQTAFNKGVEAGETSNSLGGLIDNPYIDGTQEHKDWSLGFCKGYADVGWSDNPLLSAIP